MSVSAEDWDRRVDGWTDRLPPPWRSRLDWLREPPRRPLRVGAALLLVLGGLMSILPVLGLWMLPLGLALLSQDVPWIKVPLEHAARAVEGAWHRVSARLRR